MLPGDMGLQQFEQRLERLIEGPGGLPAGALVLSDGSRVPLGEETVTLGRLPDCEVVLSDTNVSRRHAEIHLRGDHYVLVDLGSTNGSKVNGARVKERVLADGDEITLGKTQPRFEP